MLANQVPPGYAVVFQLHLGLESRKTMITHSTDYVEYCREVATNLRNVQDLALRGHNMESVTRRVQERIIREVDLQPDDDLVDIGCGDGTLLREAAAIGVSSAIGLLATSEEVAIVRGMGLHVQQGLSDSLPLADECASVVICNSVLLIVPGEKIPASLREICRISKPGARVYIGEIPFVPAHAPAERASTVRETLSELYRTHGLRTWFGMLRRIAYWKLMGKPMVIRDGAAVSFYAQPPEFIAMANEAGLRLTRYWRHDEPNTRYNYLFTRDRRQ